MQLLTELRSLRIKSIQPNTRASVSIRLQASAAVISFVVFSITLQKFLIVQARKKKQALILAWFER
jgi:hypothetical protein